MGLSFSGFKFPKFFEFEFFGLKKSGSKHIEFSSLRVREKILTKIWTKFGENVLFLWQNFYSSELNLVEFQFSGFFRVRVLAIFKVQVFFGFGFEKIAKTRRVFKFG